MGEAVETNIAGMALGQDESGIRKQAVDQARVEDIERQLVDQQGVRAARDQPVDGLVVEGPQRRKLGLRNVEQVGGEIVPAR